MSSYATSFSQTSTSSGTRQPSTENFEAAFGELSSAYGFDSSSRGASSVPRKPSKAPTNTSSSPSLSCSSSSVGFLEKEMDGVSLTEPSSQVFMVDLTRRSPLQASAPRVSAPKNNEAAFGALSSSYGFSIAVPSSQSTHSTTAHKVPNTQQQLVPASRPTTGTPTKDFEAAYGALVLQSGWGSSALPSTASQGTRFMIA